MDKKGKFLRVYANLPANLRREIIDVLPEIGPITWNAAFIEIDNNTDLGKKMLDRLEQLNFI